MNKNFFPQAFVFKDLLSKNIRAVILSRSMDGTILVVNNAAGLQWLAPLLKEEHVFQMYHLVGYLGRRLSR